MPNILYHKRSLTPFSLFWRTSLQNAFWQQRKKENLILCDRNIKYCIWKPKDMSFGNYLKYYQYNNISNTLFDIWGAMKIITIKRICIFMAPLEIYLSGLTTNKQKFRPVFLIRSQLLTLFQWYQNFATTFTLKYVFRLPHIEFCF